MANSCNRQRTVNVEVSCRARRYFQRAPDLLQPSVGRLSRVSKAILGSFAGSRSGASTPIFITCTHRELRGLIIDYCRDRSHSLQSGVRFKPPRIDTQGKSSRLHGRLSGKSQCKFRRNYPSIANCTYSATFTGGMMLARARNRESLIVERRALSTLGCLRRKGRLALRFMSFRGGFDAREKTQWAEVR